MRYYVYKAEQKTWDGSDFPPSKEITDDCVIIREEIVQNQPGYILYQYNVQNKSWNLRGHVFYPERDWLPHPCKWACEYRFKVKSEHRLQSNAIRGEGMWSDHPWRCGFRLKEGRIGGRGCDYKECWYRKLSDRRAD